MGRLTFPGLISEGEQFLDGITTLEEFRRAASKPSETFLLDAEERE